MKYAAIDIGTNSTRLLVTLAEKNAEGSIMAVPIFREMKITRLGKNLSQTKKINSVNAFSTVEVLKEYQKLLKSYNVAKYRAVGTRVLRLAEDSDEFIHRVFNETGLNVEIISGKKEAALSFYGAVRGLGHGNFSKISRKPAAGQQKSKNILVVDIGGGSTEFILGKPAEGKINYLDSVDIGSVALSEKFLSDAKPDNSSIVDLLHFIEDKLKNTLEKISRTGFDFMVGLAGTVSSLAAIDLKIKKYNREKIHTYVLHRKKVVDIFNRLCLTDLETRKKITGLEPARADIIIGGTAILLKILEMLDIESFIVSENDILDGIINGLL